MSRARSAAARWAVAALLVGQGLPHDAAASPAHGVTAQASVRGVVERRVALLALSPPLVRALHTALVPWRMQLEVVDREPPRGSVPGSARQAQLLARELDADVLVWVSSDAEGEALWIYEAAEDAVRARPFPGQLLDDARAAALALSVKTWLRLDAEPPPALATPAPAEATLAPSPPPPRSQMPRADLQQDVQSSDEIPRTVPAGSARARALLHAEARGGALQPTPLEARYGVELRALAWHGQTHERRVWLGARLDTGTPVAISNASFRGSLSHWSGGLSAGVGQRLAPVLYANLLGGVTLAHATLSGTLLADGAPAERARWQTALHLRPELELELAPLALILQPTLYAAPHTQRFLADGAEVLRTRKLWWSLGAAISLDLFE